MLQVTVVVMVAVLSSGCVSKSKHEGTVKDLRACRADRDRIEADRDAQVRKLETRFGEELKATKAELDELRKLKADAEKRAALFKELNAKFEEMISTGQIKVYVRRGRMIVALPSSVLFASGKAELTKRGSRTLARVARKLKGLDGRRFIVAGHTDNVPIGKKLDFVDNWQLSSVRALNVTRFLIESGMSAKNLSAAGYGEFDPVRSNKTNSGRRRNRRIELMLVPNIPALAKSK